MTSDDVIKLDQFTEKARSGLVNESSKSGYGFALVTSLLTILLHWVFEDSIGSGAYLYIYPAAFIVSSLSGLKPAILASLFCWFGVTYLSVGFDLALLSSQPSLIQTSFVFFATTFLTCWIIAKQRKKQNTNARDIIKLIESGQQHNLLTEAPVMIWVSNTEKMFTKFSKGWILYTGRTTAQELGNGWISGIHPEDTGNFLSIFIDSFDSKNEFQTQYRLRHHSGAYRWITNCGRPHYDEKGIFRGFIGACMEIHEQKVQEEKLKLALVARDEFLSIASHELKTPLTSLKLKAQMNRRALLKKDPRVFSEEGVIAFIELIEKQSSRLNRLVDDMLDVSRIRSGRLTIETEVFDLCEVIEDVVTRMREIFVQGKIPIPIIIKCTQAVGVWDKLRIEQVVTNLLTNALRYGRGRPVSIIVKRLDSGFIRLEVRDEGLGISPVMKDIIFNRFERAVDSDKISGLGLGLFIAKQIVKAHGGHIGVESELHVGSMFFIELPALNQNFVFGSNTHEN